MGICDVGDKDIEVLGESAGGLLYRLDSITIIADNHRLNSLALEFIDLDIGDLLSESCYNSHSGIIVEFQLTGQGYNIKDALHEDNRIGLALGNSIVVIQKFGEGVIDRVAVAQYLEAAIVLDLAVMGVDIAL